MPWKAGLGKGLVHQAGPVLGLLCTASARDTHSERRGDGTATEAARGSHQSYSTSYTQWYTREKAVWVSCCLCISRWVLRQEVFLPGFPFLLWEIAGFKKSLLRQLCDVCAGNLRWAQETRDGFVVFSFGKLIQRMRKLWNEVKYQLRHADCSRWKLHLSSSSYCCANPGVILERFGCSAECRCDLGSMLTAVLDGQVQLSHGCWCRWRCCTVWPGENWSDGVT